MKKWSLVVAVLYGLAVLVLIGPLGWIAFSRGSKFMDMTEVLLTLELWAVIAVMIITQFALLRVPVHSAFRRPITRRPLLVTLCAAAFMMGLLAFGAAASIFEFITRLEGSGGALWIPAGVGLGSWGFWCVYFYRHSERQDTDQKLSKFKRFFIKGSILELLIAVPTHIVARHRDYCCAGMLTFVSLTCGLSVMLFAFGPSIYFLFLARWKRLHPSHEAAL